ncbi:MAG: HAD-IIB family hydrolase [Gammaproteobacteria bacterium]|nr:HAD-IIB family hydrolase [Gammaproteobacteria bacterium]
MISGSTKILKKSGNSSLPKKHGLYIQLISIHGLIRAENLELGRDADTGGQIKYVLELATALAQHKDVERVDVLTRQIFSTKLDPVYATPIEPLSPGVNIVRLPCGPKRYLRKEALWAHLDSFSDAALQHVKKIGRIPDLIHSHYADAGYVASSISSLLSVPMVHTGHSLGRVKRERLLEKGLRERNIETQYAMTQRIEAEEMALDNAAAIIASTNQEVEEQYQLYDNYTPKRISVIPPGVDLTLFSPPTEHDTDTNIKRELSRFLKNPDKPMILAISRADPRKNIATLIKAYGENEQLRDKANLVIIAGNRDDIVAMEKTSRRVLQELLYLIDYYDLHGSIAYPKKHSSEDIPDLYRLAATSKGVFINPALTEPFGLTLLEAAASGLPIIAPNDGGPRDILRHCKNGVVIDPLDSKKMSAQILKTITDHKTWQQWSKNGILGVAQYYTWKGHVDNYIEVVKDCISKHQQATRTVVAKSKLAIAERLLICDIDNTLIGDRAALSQLTNQLKRMGDKVAFGVATGRTIQSTLRELKKWDAPIPDVFITSVGSEIRYGSRLTEDLGWQQHNDYRWKPKEVYNAMRDFNGLKLQHSGEQRRHKISFNVDPKKAPKIREIRQHLRQCGIHVKLIYSHEAYLDILPIRTSKGTAVRHVAMKWGFPLDQVLVVGDSGNDEEMLSGNTLGVVVSNHSPELKKLRGRDHIYFAENEYAKGVLEGIKHYRFLDKNTAQ